jgi:hypothetical protein
MPALFAYLIAVGLLLGSGYGALSWLASPEPVKVAAKAKPKSPPPPPHYSEESAPASAQVTPQETGRADASAPVANESEQAKTASNALGALPEPNQPAAANGSAAPAEAPARDLQLRTADAESPAADTKPGIKPAETQPAQPAASVSPISARSAASNASSAAAKTIKRAHPQRQANRYPDKRGLALMTLRTIEFPDGRRVTQLIPYRGGERALAFQPDE